MISSLKVRYVALATELNSTDRNWEQLEATESRATESNWEQLRATTESNWPQLTATESNCNANWKQLVAKSATRDFTLRDWQSKVRGRTPTRRALLG